MSKRNQGSSPRKMTSPLSCGVEVVLPVHGFDRDPLLVGGSWAEGVVSAWYLEGVAFPGYLLSQLSYLPGAKLFDEVLGQAAGDLPAVGPLGLPARDHVSRGGTFVESDEVAGHYFRSPSPREAHRL